MSLIVIAATMLLLTFGGFYLGRHRALRQVDGTLTELHSLPAYHGLYMALWIILPPLIAAAFWLFLEGPLIEYLVFESLPAAMTDVSAGRLSLLEADIKSLAAGNIASQPDDPKVQAAAEYYNFLHTWSDRLLAGLLALLGLGGFLYSRHQIRREFRARAWVERIIMILLVLCSVVAILTTVGIVLSLLFEALRFFQRVPPSEFFFGLQWSPQSAIRETQAVGPGTFGVIPLLTGTLLITVIAMVVAVPIGLLSAIYMVEFASPKLRASAKPIIEILAGVPTVVYGFFAAITVAPLISDFGQSLGLDVSSQSALAAGSVMGIMVIPSISSLSDDVISSVPQKLRHGALAVGATDAETIRHIVLPAALPGIIGAVLLAVSHAIGETMIVLMAAGLYANLTVNPLEAVTTITVQIATLLTGDQEFDSAKTLSAFALGLFLFVVTLILNIIALKITQHYHEKYD